MATIRCREVSFQNIEAVLFDKDGTLEDSWEFLRELALKRVRLIDAQIPGTGEPLLMAFGLQDNRLDPSGLMAVGSRWENEIAAAAYIAETGRGWYTSLKIAQDAFAEADCYLKRTQTQLLTGSLEVLKRLREAGLKLGILSADSTAEVQAFIERHQLSEYIQLALGSSVPHITDDRLPQSSVHRPARAVPAMTAQPRSEKELFKPDPALYLKACQLLSVAPELTLMVGDAQGDIEMAKQAGAAGTVAISSSKTPASYLDMANVQIMQLDETHIYA